MKRIILCCLSVILVLTALLPLSVSASSSQTGIFSVTDAEGKQGENIVVYVEMSANSGVSALMLSVTYDTECFELLKAESGDLECIFSPIEGNPQIDGSPFTLSWVDVDKHITEETTLAKLTFKIKETASTGAGYIYVSFDRKNIFNATAPGEFEQTSFYRSSGYVRILCNHVFDSYTYRNSSQHKKNCSKCGEYELASHAWDSGKVTQSATHTEAGVRTYTCADCGGTKTETIATSNAHSYGNWVNYSSAQHKRTCSCGSVEYASHTWDGGRVTQAATHTEAGVRTYTCTDCGAVKTETILKTSEHSYGKWTVLSATQHQRTCACGSVESASHSWDNGKVVTPAAHTMPGMRTYTCTDCSATRSEQIPTTAGHGFGEWESISSTQHRRSCSCGESETASHRWDGGKVTKPATHTRKGVRTYTCTDCGATKTDSLPIISQHTYEGDWQYNYEKHWKECVCGQKGSNAEHTYSAWVITKQATKHETGIKERTCTACSYKEAVVIDRVVETQPVATTPVTKPVTTPNAPVTTPNAPVTTPNAPVTTPNAPVTTPNAPVTTPNAPVTTPNAPVTTPNAPVTDTPATDVPATDAPATDTPVTDTPATDVPATDAPVTDKPVNDTTTEVTTTTANATVTTGQQSSGLGNLLADQWRILVIGALALILVIIVIIIVIVLRKNDD